MHFLMHLVGKKNSEHQTEGNVKILRRERERQRSAEFFMNVFIYSAGNTERKVMEKHSEREVSVENHFCKYSVKIKGIGGGEGEASE